MPPPLTARVPEEAGLGQRVRLGLLEGGREAVYLDGATWRDEDVLYGLLLVAVLAEAFLALPPLQDDVDVAGNQRGDLLACTEDQRRH